MVDLYGALSWIVPTILGTLLAVFAYISKEGFRKGAVKGQSEVTTTVLGNTIKELERTNNEMEKLVHRLDDQNTHIIRLQERLRYVTVQLNELKQRLGMPKVRFEDVEKDENWK